MGFSWFAFVVVCSLIHVWKTNGLHVLTIKHEIPDEMGRNKQVDLEEDTPQKEGLSRERREALPTKSCLPPQVKDPVVNVTAPAGRVSIVSFGRSHFVNQENLNISLAGAILANDSNPSLSCWTELRRVEGAEYRLMVLPTYHVKSSQQRTKPLEPFLFELVARSDCDLTARQAFTLAVSNVEFDVCFNINLIFSVKEKFSCALSPVLEVVNKVAEFFQVAMSEVIVLSYQVLFANVSGSGYVEPTIQMDFSLSNKVFDCHSCNPDTIMNITQRIAREIKWYRHGTDSFTITVTNATAMKACPNIPVSSASDDPAWIYLLALMILPISIFLALVLYIFWKQYRYCCDHFCICCCPMCCCCLRGYFNENDDLKGSKSQMSFADEEFFFGFNTSKVNKAGNDRGRTSDLTLASNCASEYNSIRRLILSGGDESANSLEPSVSATFAMRDEVLGSDEAHFAGSPDLVRKSRMESTSFTTKSDTNRFIPRDLPDEILATRSTIANSFSAPVIPSTERSTEIVIPSPGFTSMSGKGADNFAFEEFEMGEYSLVESELRLDSLLSEIQEVIGLQICADAVDLEVSVNEPTLDASLAPPHANTAASARQLERSAQSKEKTHCKEIQSSASKTKVVVSEDGKHIMTHHGGPIESSPSLVRDLVTDVTMRRGDFTEHVGVPSIDRLLPAEDVCDQTDCAYSNRECKAITNCDDIYATKPMSVLDLNQKNVALKKSDSDHESQSSESIPSPVKGQTTSPKLAHEIQNHAHWIDDIFADAALLNDVDSLMGRSTKRVEVANAKPNVAELRV